MYTIFSRRVIVTAGKTSFKFQSILTSHPGQLNLTIPPCSDHGCGLYTTLWNVSQKCTGCAIRPVSFISVKRLKAE